MENNSNNNIFPVSATAQAETSDRSPVIIGLALFGFVGVLIAYGLLQAAFSALGGGPLITS